VLDASALLPELIGHDVPSQILKAGRRLDLHAAPPMDPTGTPAQQAFAKEGA
jgi:hydroxymethylglutaryl-CoA lyase